ncbi:energy transducer TonB [Glaciimonas immobilis]|uniref:Protein TonB n=1 Tax=Glaciimonas immobilis TaxID=728004 RepID=A0A840RXM9_9BURK|nr:energy transducer TonB [Glaciimonas immobilis]KAF3996447.1 energy transducer TonB [Glaciimonas immobilis]MBB5201210.1 protein TonB [Glaciimonas immobilis]
MDFQQGDTEPARNFTGIAFVVLLHALLIYALVTGLARKIVAVIQQPVETRIIEEFKPPPPPDKLVPPPPKLIAPPPPFIPPPEVKVQQVPQESVIAAVTNVKPVSNELPTTTASIAPTPATHAIAPAAPLHTAAVVSAKGCEKPEYPSTSLRNEEEGTVTLAFLIGIDGTVVDSKVEKSSGSRDLDKAARAGLSLCKFKPATTDGKPEQSWTRIQYAWKLD